MGLKETYGQSEPLTITPLNRRFVTVTYFFVDFNILKINLT